MKKIKDLTIKIFADGADKASMLEMSQRSYIKGLTTNPTLMRKAGISDYASFAKNILQHIQEKPISFEVFSDDFEEMEEQAHLISSWGNNVYVKIPVMNTKAIPAYDLIHRLANAGIKQNITALMTLEQVNQATQALSQGPSAYISVFAGRIADTGCDPLPLMKQSLEQLKPYHQLELIWASPRELLNIFQADEIGCHIITVTNDILSKLALVGKNLEEFSLETVKMFYNDAQLAGFSLLREEIV